MEDVKKNITTFVSEEKFPKIWRLMIDEGGSGCEATLRMQGIIVFKSLPPIRGQRKMQVLFSYLLLIIIKLLLQKET